MTVGYQSWGSVDLGEYDSLFGWERRAAIERFRIYFDQGQSHWPAAAEFVRDRAVFFGYRGALSRWLYLTAAASVGLGGALQFRGDSWWRAVLIAVVGAAEAIAVGGGILRSRQARRRHPDYRRYRLDPLAQERKVRELTGATRFEA